ncbi:unnamed protein product [Callosobruchus maculatus]|uniref:Nose resistant-to-fluoxetine protein N-terminal domain-containing protein n=2 Tax=Callosobruchus maculatus TaxID=64391 RepID=A0A653DQM4_CALMS|nr:unnamed protein product [Callosobruchus maculatus]
MITKFLGLLLVCVASAKGDVFGNQQWRNLGKDLVIDGELGEGLENVSLVEGIEQFQKGLLDCSRIEKANIYEGCKDQLLEICSNQPFIGIQMLDAASKIPSGVMEASRLDLGNFDECEDIDYHYNKGRILGKYCAAGLVIPDFKNVSDKDLWWKLAICIPDQCSAKDLISLFKLPLFTDKVCSTKEPKNWEAGNIVTLFVVCCTLLLMVLSTAYDYITQRQGIKPHHPLLNAYSVLTNTQKVLQTSEGNREQIEVFHGMKTISMMWVIAGHGFVGFTSFPVSNYNYGIKWQTDHLYVFYITAAPLAVDTFFYMSGFLLAYHYFKVKHNSAIAQIKSIPLLYIHRYLRITPAVLMLYLCSVYLLPYLGSGPFYQQYCKDLTVSCETNWWSFLLYIQNYYNYDNLCMTHTWYLSADMQMFILAPLIMIPLAMGLHHGKFKLCMFGMLLINVIFTFLPMILKLQYRDYTNAYDTHSRIINYTMGIMVGLFMRERKHLPFLFSSTMTKSKRSTINLGIWAAILLGMLATCICYQAVEMQNDYVNKTVFYSLMRPAWCIGLSWILYSSYYGYGGVVNWFLGRPIFQVGGKLSYSMYLVHGIVIAHYVMMLRVRAYFSEYIEFYQWCAYLMISVFVAFLWTLAFESPMITVEKFIFGEIAKKAQKPEGRKDTNTA